MVEFVDFKEKRLPVRVSYYALSKYKEETGVEFDEKSITGGDSFKMFEPIFFYSLESGHRAIGEKMTIKRKEMFEVLEECFMQFAKVLPKFFPDEKDIGKKSVAPAVGNRQQRRVSKEKKGGS